VTVISDYGCTSTDSLTVSIDENHFVYIPNVFSPNGDGKNDNFKLFANNKVKKILNMEIYNRWGDKVYAKSDIEISPEDDGWDGTFNGTDVTPSVYIYMFEVELFSGEIIMYSGDVTLLR
jgi:gliding motility-associated-like protein